jgi:hypothetical protein
VEAQHLVRVQRCREQLELASHVVALVDERVVPVHFPDRRRDALVEAQQLPIRDDGLAQQVVAGDDVLIGIPGAMALHMATILSWHFVDDHRKSGPT